MVSALAMPVSAQNARDLLDRSQARSMVITRRGRPVARIGPVEPPDQPIDFKALEEFRKTMPPWPKSSTELIREMRDDYRD